MRGTFCEFFWLFVALYEKLLFAFAIDLQELWVEVCGFNGQRLVAPGGYVGVSEGKLHRLVMFFFVHLKLIR